MVLNSILGGGLIGLASSLLLIANGRIMGASGIAGVVSAGIAKSLFHSRMARFELFWRSTFLLGVMAGGVFLLQSGVPAWMPSMPTQSLPKIASAGLLVGIGTRMGMGCTSGHGVCGIGRRSGRSLIATLTFIIAAMLTVFILKRLTP